MATGIKPQHGITADTYKRLALDSGVVVVNYGLPGEAVLGATRGGNTFTIEDEIREMLADGSPGPIKGSQRRTRSVAKLSVNLLEVKTSALLMQLPGSESSVDGGSHDKIIRCEQISSGDYLDNISLIINKNDTDEVLVFSLKNALALNGFELGAAEDDEAVITMEFTAHFDPTVLATEPWEIYNPLEGAVVRYTLTYTAGANGTIIGDAVQSVVTGTSGTAVYANPAALYEFVDWSDLSTDNPRIDTGVVANVTVTANFALI